MSLTYASVCSGIEAPGIATRPLGWRPLWFAEIAPFPSAVLAHHYPDVQNYGDFTTLIKNPPASPDVLIGGTPCQSFSVAGLRGGLTDHRGNLALAFMALVDVLRPRWLLWENVPGVLSSNGGRDFGSILGALGKLGYGFAYRVLDAQFFGLAQRRKRVFLVGYSGDWRRPAAALFEPESLRRDSPPRRGSGAGVTGAVGTGASGGGGWRVGADEAAAGHVLTVGLRDSDGETARSLNAHPTRMDLDTETFVAHTLRGNGHDASEDGTGRGVPLVPVAFAHQTGGWAPNQGGTCVAYQCHGSNVGEMGTLRGGNGHLTGGVPFIAVPPVSTALRARDGARGVDSDATDTLVAVQESEYGTMLTDTAGSLRADRESGGTYALAPIVFNNRGRAGGAQIEVDPTGLVNLRAAGGGSSRSMVAVPLASLEGDVMIRPTHEVDRASTPKADPGTLLRALRDEVGEEAFTEWGSGVSDTLRRAEVLRPEVHGGGVQESAAEVNELGCEPLPCKEDCPGGSVCALWRRGCSGCPPLGWRPREQLAGELGAYLPLVSHESAPHQGRVSDLREADGCERTLRDALSAIEDARRPGVCQAADGVPGVRGASEREGAMRPSLHAAEARFGVRRLSATEMERLMGFPDSYTAIPWRGKPAGQCPDGPRAKALGNSMATNVIRWICERIEIVDAIPSKGTP